MSRSRHHVLLAALIAAGCDRMSGGDKATETAEPEPPPSTSVTDHEALLPDGTACDGLTDSSIAIGCALADADAWTERRLSFPEGATCIISTGFRDAMDQEFCTLYPTSDYCSSIEGIPVGSTCGFEVAHPSQLLAIRDLHGSASAPYVVLGNGATLQADDAMPRTGGHGLWLMADSSFIELSDLTLDGRRADRPASETIESAHNLYISSCEDISLRDIRTVNSVADGYYLGGIETDPDQFSKRVVATNLVADNSARNTASIINATDCAIEGGELTNAVDAGIDLEPDFGSAEPGILNFALTDTTISGNGGRCVQLSPMDSPVGPLVQVNTLSSCRHAASECGPAIVVGHPATIIDNTIMDFDLDCRSLIDFLADERSADTVGSGNTISDIRHDGTELQAIFYIHDANGGGHTITENILQSIRADADAGWCNDQNVETDVVVQDNTIDGLLQDPNPGCSYN